MSGRYWDLAFNAGQMELQGGGGCRVGWICGRGDGNRRQKIL